jgi:predicted HicB family RNase H-like nuclease
MLSVRIHEAARRSFGELAEQRGVSVSEYVCHLLNDHLRDVVKQDIRSPSWSTQ